MTQLQISKAEIDAIFPRLAEAMADALGCEVEEVKLDSSLIDDLQAESIDFLDIVFRLEKTFKVKIPRGKILEESQGSLTPEQFENSGVVTPEGLAQLKAYLSEVPESRFKSPLNVSDIPRLFTPETFCKLVIRAQKEQAAGS